MPSSSAVAALAFAVAGTGAAVLAQGVPAVRWFELDHLAPWTPRSRALLTRFPGGAADDLYFAFGRDAAGATLLDQRRRSPSGVWSPVVTTQRPTYPVGGGAAYDPGRQVIVYFGGDTGTTGSGELWEFDGVDWTLRTLPALPPPPPGRRGCTVTYVPPLNRVLVVGGFAGPSNLPLGDVWGWNGTSMMGYSALPSTARRGDHATVFQPGTSRLVVFGGSDGTSLRNDTWVLNVTTLPLSWSQTATANPPPARTRAAMAADADSGHVCLFGGQGASGALGDTWILDNATWTSSVPAIGTVPSARSGAAAVQGDQGMFAIGGDSGMGVCFAETWELQLDVARARTYGAGCGTPTLAVTPNTRPRLGMNFDCTVQGVPGALHFMMVGLGDSSFGGAPLPLNLAPLGAPSCNLYQDAAITTSAAINLTAPPATYVSSTSLPNLPAFVGFVFYLQPLAVDVTIVPLGIFTGNAVRATVGTH